MPQQPDLIYFGLMPHKRDPEVEVVSNGFQGCMKHLQVGLAVHGLINTGAILLGRNSKDRGLLFQWSVHLLIKNESVWLRHSGNPPF